MERMTTESDEGVHTADDAPGASQQLRRMSVATGMDDAGAYPLLNKAAITRMAQMFAAALLVEDQYAVQEESKLRGTATLLESFIVVMSLICIEDDGTGTAFEIEVDDDMLMTRQHVADHLLNFLQVHNLVDDADAQVTRQHIVTAMLHLVFRPADSDTGIDVRTFVSRIYRELHHRASFDTFVNEYKSVVAAASKGGSLPIEMHPFVLKNMQNIAIIVADFMLTRPSATGMMSLKPRALMPACGLGWKVLEGGERPKDGRELTDENLRDALSRTRQFTKQEWEQFGIRDLRPTDFIFAGGSYFRPVQTEHRDGIISIADAYPFHGEWCAFTIDCEDTATNGVVKVYVRAFAINVRLFVIEEVANHFANDFNFVIRDVISQYIVNVAGYEMNGHLHNHNCDIYLDQAPECAYMSGCTFLGRCTARGFEELTTDETVKLESLTTPMTSGRKTVLLQKLRNKGKKHANAVKSDELSAAEKKMLEDKANAAAAELLAIDDREKQRAAKAKRKKALKGKRQPNAAIQQDISRQATDVAPVATETDVVATETDVAPVATETDVAPVATETDVAPVATETDVAPVATETEHEVDQSLDTIAQRTQRIVNAARAIDVHVNTIGGEVDDAFVYDLCAYNVDDAAILDVLRCERPANADEKRARHDVNVSGFVEYMRTATVSEHTWRAYGCFREERFEIVEYLLNNAQGTTLSTFLLPCA